MKPLHTLLLLLVAAPLWATDLYSHQSWPGEGRPQFTWAANEVNLYAEPEAGSPQHTEAVAKGAKVEWDDSLQKAIRPVVMRVLEPFELSDCGPAPIALERGQVLETLFYRAEGYHMVRVGDRLCEMMLFDYEEQLSNTDRKPESEWWVRVTKPEGWLMPDEQIVHQDRQF